jgi:hypothetical protein
MEKTAEQKSTVSRSARLLSYSSTIATIVLFTVAFYVLSEHHSKLQELESSKAPGVKHKRDIKAEEILYRSARQFGFGLDAAVRGFVLQVVEEVVAEKWKELRATCLDNCTQGPKGDSGAKGTRGDKGSSGNKGDKGESGDRGEKGDQGMSVTGLTTELR